MKLLSNNDLRHLSAAQHRGKEIALERETADGTLRVMVRTMPVNSPPWTVPMVIHIEVWEPRMKSYQNLASVEDLRRFWGKICQPER